MSSLPRATIFAASGPILNFAVFIQIGGTSADPSKSENTADSCLVQIAVLHSNTSSFYSLA